MEFVQKKKMNKLQCKSSRKRSNNSLTEAPLTTTKRTNVEEEESMEEIERRVKALQRLVPGGENMEMETLFEETADYIEALRGQVTVMRSLTDFVDAVVMREKKDFGGKMKMR